MEEHLNTLQLKTNARILNGELVKDGDRYECVVCKSSLGKFSVEKQFTTKNHLDNVNNIGKDEYITTNITKDISKDITEDITNEITKDMKKDIASFCLICNTIYEIRNTHYNSIQHEEKVIERKLKEEIWKFIATELSLNHKMGFNSL